MPSKTNSHAVPPDRSRALSRNPIATYQPCVLHGLVQKELIWSSGWAQHHLGDFSEAELAAVFEPAGVSASRAAPSTFTDVHCLSLAFHCLSLAFHCLSLTFHCRSTAVHCLSYFISVPFLVVRQLLVSASYPQRAEPRWAKTAANHTIEYRKCRLS